MSSLNCKVFFLREMEIVLASVSTLVAFPANAQEEVIYGSDSVRNIPKTTFTQKQVDASDIFNELFGAGTQAKDTDKTAVQRFHFTCLPAVAYTSQTRFVALASSNLAFYTNIEQQDHLSVVNATINFTQKHQVIFPILSNIWTKDNSFNFQGNWTYYKYPENTYGLGGYSNKLKPDPISYRYILIREAALKHIYRNISAGVGYALDYHSNIRELKGQSKILTDFDKYGKTKSSVSSGLTFNFLFDQRKNPINPTQGFYGNIVFRPNYIFMGSKSNWQSLLVDFRKYVKLSSVKDNILAFWSYNLFTLSGSPPYLDLPSNGWDNNSTQGRGYMQSRFRGRNLLSLESEYRFQILDNGLLGGAVFTGAESLPNWPGNRLKSVLPSGGAGLRVKLNKHSNTNLAFDYGIGKGRSRGFFINLGEAF